MNDSEKIISILSSKYGEINRFLEFSTPFELAIAVMLSAQCTDDRVNKVTREMFKKANKPEDFASLSVEEIENMIHSINFYHNKAKNVKKCSEQIMEQFGGILPNNMDDLQKLAGIGRKSANVIMNEAFGECEGIAVDTHVFRISRRLGLSSENEPKKVEKDLLKTFPKKYWPVVNHVLILHGRNVCKAQKPLCEECEVAKYCKFYKEMKKKII